MTAGRSKHEPSAPALVPTAPVQSWALTAEAVGQALDVDPARGLSEAEVRQRRQRYGVNRLRGTKPRSAWQMLRDQVASPIVALLAVATLVALAFGERLEALAIGAVLAINTVIGFSTERRAVRSMEALRELGRVDATVRRAGSQRVVPAEEIVPGDVVVLEAGDVLTADLRLVLASRLQVDESALTGESLAVEKNTEPSPADAALVDRGCMLFKGTAVTRGAAEGLVVATGMQTELGQIARLVAEAEPEVTPLEARLDRLGRRLIVLSLGIAALVVLANLWSGRELYLSIEIALALAVAAVPEGLPIVATMALARGMWRMARRHAVVEQLSAVETLGSTSVILADKTGTLTENRMAVAEIALSDGRTVTVHPDVRPDDAEAKQAARATGFSIEDAAVEPAAIPLLESALRVFALCNNAELAGDPSDGAVGTGDPTELALLLAARRAGLERGRLLEHTPEVGEIAFDSAAKEMATLHRDGQRILAAVKGAPETVIAQCTRRVASGGAVIEMTAEARAHWLERAEEMASRGERVLAVATRSLDEPEAFRYGDLTFVGLAGLLDPPRAGVRSAVEACQAAGIRVVMVTGDHLGTARNIAAATGLWSPADGDPTPCIDARSFPRFDQLDAAGEAVVLATPVIARATPQQKLELIALFQRHGAVVAMTGDGVNDAPALKKADIGVAMGQRGTQVAREAAEMVLQDDEFGTIVAAVAQGRAIFANIRRFVVYLMSCNASEILAVAVASLAQGPLPILPLQILFLNLVTDVFPALALGAGEGSPALMREPPRSSDESLLTRRHWRWIFGFGGVIAAAVLGSLVAARALLDKSAPEATTISFLTLALAQLWHVFSMRGRRSSWWNNEVTRNRWVWLALLLCLGLIGLAVHWAPLASVLSIAQPGADGWALALAASLVPLLVGQATLAVSDHRAQRAAS